MKFTLFDRSAYQDEKIIGEIISFSKPLSLVQNKVVLAILRGFSGKTISEHIDNSFLYENA